MVQADVVPGKNGTFALPLRAPSDISTVRLFRRAVSCSSFFALCLANSLENSVTYSFKLWSPHAVKFIKLGLILFINRTNRYRFDHVCLQQFNIFCSRLQAIGAETDLWVDTKIQDPIRYYL